MATDFTGRRRMWLLTAAALTLGTGIAFAHGLLIAAGLVLAGLSGLGKPATGCPPPEMGAGTDGPRRPGHEDWTCTGGARREHPDMDITHTTVPGTGTLHHLVTRGGQRFGVLTTHGTRQLLVYEPGDNPDVPAQTIDLDADEADQIAGLLHTRPLADRVAALERIVAGRECP